MKHDVGEKCWDMNSVYMKKECANLVVKEII